jgi:hypothetical protein
MAETNRIVLSSYNASTENAPLSFTNLGWLMSPDNSFTELNIESFTIKGANLPIVEFANNTYSFTMTYLGFSYTSFMVLEDRGTGTNIDQIDQWLSMINTTLSNCLTGLALLTTIPTQVTAPYVMYNNVTQLYEMVAISKYTPTLPPPFIAYSTPKPFITPSINNINLYCNAMMHVVLDSMPSVEDDLNPNPNLRFRFIFDSTPMTYYVPPNPITNDEYLKIQQTMITASNYASVSTILIIAESTVQEVLFATDSLYPPGQAIVQSYNIPYDRGLIDFQTSFEFNAVSPNYRAAKINGGINNHLILNVKYLNRANQIRDFTCPPNTNSSILVHLDHQVFPR